MATLTIRKISDKVWKHSPSDSNTYIISKLYIKSDGDNIRVCEFNGAIRAEYNFADIVVYDIGGIAETFTSSQEVMERLEALNYVGFFSDGEVSPSDLISSDANNGLELGTDGKLFTKNGEILITNASVTGTYNINWNASDVWGLTLTGNTTLTESNLPSSGHTKTITLQISGNFTLSYPTYWTDFISGAYDGVATLNTITIQYFGSGKYKVLIVQPD